MFVRDLPKPLRISARHLWQGTNGVRSQFTQTSQNKCQAPMELRRRSLDCKSRVHARVTACFLRSAQNER